MQHKSALICEEWKRFVNHRRELLSLNIIYRLVRRVARANMIALMWIYVWQIKIKHKIHLDILSLDVLVHVSGGEEKKIS